MKHVFKSVILKMEAGKMTDQKPLNLNNPVRKANNLIQGKYTMNQAESKIMDVILSLLPEVSENINYIEVPTNKLCEFCKINLRELKDATKSMVKAYLSFVGEDATGKKVELQTTWLSSAVYMPSKGLVRLRINDDLKPYLLDLRRNKRPYTQFAIKELVSSTYYTKRIYEVACQYKSIGKRPKLDIIELRDMLGIEEGKYGKFSHFRDRVLDTAIKNIEENKDMEYSVSYELEKVGRAYTHIIFYTKKKKVISETKDTDFTNSEENKGVFPALDFENMPIPDIKEYLIGKKLSSEIVCAYGDLELRYIAQMIDNGINVVVLSQFLDSKGFEYVKDNNEIAIKRSQAGNARSYGALFFVAVKNDYAREEKLKDAHKPIKKSSYDIQKLEDEQKSILDKQNSEEAEKELFSISQFEIEKLNNLIAKGDKGTFGEKLILQRYEKIDNPKIQEAIELFKNGEYIPVDFFK